MEQFKRNDFKRFLTRCLKNNRWTVSGSHSLKPTVGTNAPPITWYQSGKIELGPWCYEVVSCCHSELQKGFSHYGAHCVRTSVIRTCATKAISEKSSEWFGRARNERFTEKIAVLLHPRRIMWSIKTNHFVFQSIAVWKVIKLSTQQ